MFHIRAFSLFAPLVGTSVMIIAIIMASVLVQNDIRTSRGITASYSRGELAGVAEAIRAYIFATTADTVISSVHGTLHLKSRYVQCADSAGCISKMGNLLANAMKGGTITGLVGTYDLVVPAFVGAVEGAYSDWSGNVRDKMQLHLVGEFVRGDPSKGEDPQASYVNISAGTLLPEEYTIRLTKGDITESVPMLPPQGLRIKLPWKIHNLSDALSQASGNVLNESSSGGLDVTQTCTWEQVICCGEDDCWCCGCDSTGYSLSGKLATSWDVSNIVSDSGSGCPSISGILDDAKAAAVINAYLLQTIAIPDFSVEQLVVQVSGSTSQNAPPSSCDDCPSTYGYFRMTPANVTIGWSVKSKPGISPQLETNISYRNYP